MQPDNNLEGGVIGWFKHETFLLYVRYCMYSPHHSKKKKKIVYM